MKKGCGDKLVTDAVFKIKGLQKSYKKHQVLKGVNLKVFQGEILGIIGSSGSGKTTLLSSMIGFLKPNRGEIKVLIEPQHRALGKPTYKELTSHMQEVKQIYGFASQIPSFYDNLTVKENLEYFGSLYDLPKKTLKTNSDILLHLMDLEPAKNMLASKLSGGMERRLDIACALMHDPSVLILDEPTADLDPVLRNHIYDLIEKINAKNTTIILASHHLTDIEHLCDRVAFLHKGVILAVGTPNEIKDKFSKHFHVKIKLKSGSLHKMLEDIKDHQSFKKYMTKAQASEQEIIIHTDKPEHIMKEVLDLAKKRGSKLETLEMSKPNLDDIFISIVERGVEQ